MSRGAADPASGHGHAGRHPAGCGGVAVGAATTADSAALAQALAAAEPGQSVRLTVTRDGQQRTVRVTLGELPGS